MKSTYKHQKKSKDTTKKIHQKKHAKRKRGGEIFSSSTPVSLVYNGQSVNCDACKQNLYEEATGSLGKSKGRSVVSSFFFGDLGQSLDTTSIITYFCTNCGLAKIVRNLDYRKVRPGAILAAPPAEAPAAAAPATTNGI